MPITVGLSATYLYKIIQAAQIAPAGTLPLQKSRGIVQAVKWKGIIDPSKRMKCHTTRNPKM
jgi:hypothetical protein